MAERSCQSGLKHGCTAVSSGSALPVLTAPQRTILRNLANGRDVFHGAHGRSQHGGFTATIASLVRRGWAAYVDTQDGFKPLRITTLGREVLGGGEGKR